MGYFFYDLTAKLNWRLSDKDRLYLSSYFGRDVFTFNNQDLDFIFNVPWGNATASLRWNHLFNDKLFNNTLLDGEMVKDNSKSWVYVINDMYVYCFLLLLYTQFL